MEAKKKADSQRNHARKTGGGPPLSPLKESQASVLSVIGDDIEPLENPNDPLSPIQSWEYEEHLPPSSREIFTQADVLHEITPDVDITPTNLLNNSTRISNIIKLKPYNLTSADQGAIHKENITPGLSSKRSKEPVSTSKINKITPGCSNRTSKLLSMKALQEEALILAKTNEEEKLKQNELKTKILEIDYKNATEVLAANQYHTLTAKLKYEAQLLLKSIAEANLYEKK